MSEENNHNNICPSCDKYISTYCISDKMSSTEYTEKKPCHKCRIMIYVYINNTSSFMLTKKNYNKYFPNENITKKRNKVYPRYGYDDILRKQRCIRNKVIQKQK